MALDPEVRPLAGKLSAAVQVTMNPTSSPAERMEAYQFCEEFKESSPHCAPCGMMMAEKSQPGIVRHFGLQILEHCIKFRWNDIITSDKLFIKNQAIELMAFGTQDLLTEELYIKDALTRIIVEMIKREWPQQWPEMLAEMNQLSQRGPTQTELVLLVFLRLVEDAVTFQNIPTGRRREILTGLTSQMEDLFSFFVNTLDTNVTTYLKSKDSENNEETKQQSLAAMKVAQSAMYAMTGYVDWINITLIFAKNGRLLEMLCTMLSDSNLQMYAAECLVLIVTRKGSGEERKPLMMLFSEDAMNAILNAAVGATEAGLSEYHYNFLKKLSQVLVGIGTQLCHLWGSEADVQQPPNFIKYLESILAITRHPSQMMRHLSYSLWSAFLRHKHISKDPVFHAYITKVMEHSITALSKIGYPSQSNSQSCAYALMDFDSDEEFSAFLAKYRAEILNNIRLTTLAMPCVTFTMVTKCLQGLLQKPLDVGEGTETGYCKLNSPAYIEWDAMSCFLEAVMSRLFRSEMPKPEQSEGIFWLKAVINYQTTDPLILSLQLSCMSSLFDYLVYTPETVEPLLKKIFSVATFNLGQSKSTRTRGVQNVRRHACSDLIKLCKTYPKLLLPNFDSFYQHIKDISSDPEELSTMERTTLMESTIIISNQFKDFEKQSNFLAEVLKPTKETWLSEEIKEAFKTTQTFMSYIGVDQAPVEPSSADTCGINRSKISTCLSYILAIIKRSQWPTDTEELKKGGFLIQLGNIEAIRNPATHHIGEMFGNLFSLIKILNELWLPENLQRRHPEFIKAYDLSEMERLAILGLPPKVIDNTDTLPCKLPVERMQIFLSLVHENCYHILGNASQFLGMEFFTSRHLARLLLLSTFTNLEYLNDFRLKPVIRGFLKSFIVHCPKEGYESVVLPVLDKLTPFMLGRLTGKWTKINQRCEDIDEDATEENSESQEVLDDQLCRQVTREYMELLLTVLFNKKGATVEQTPDDSMAVDEEKPNPASGKDEHQLSELGVLALRSENISQTLVLTAYSGLTWNDTSVCHKCVNMCLPIMKQLIEDNNMTEQVGIYMYQHVLLGLQLHGRHDGSLSELLNLALAEYEALRPMYPELVKTMQQIPNCQPQALKTFDDKLATTPITKPNHERMRKTAFKKLVEGVILKNISQKFKKEQQFTTLPPLFRKTKLKPVKVEEDDDKDLGICALFGDPQN